MTTPIKIKRSGTASSTPSSLDHGELAINYADDTLFWKDSSNVIQSFVFQAYASATHASSHATGGSDALTPGDIGAAPAASPTFTGVITVSATSGSAGSYAPSLTFSGDTNTGFGQVSGQSDTASIFTAGHERVRVDASGNIRVGGVTSNSSVNIIAPNASGTDQAGGTLVIGGTQSTGTGAGGSISFATAGAGGASGSSLNGRVTRLEIKSSGVVRFHPLSADPASGQAGDVYYNSSTNKLRVYNGTSWVDLH